MVKYEDGTVKYVGEVFNEYEQNYPDDSYWYIEAFHDGKVVQELVGTTAAGSVGVSNYTIDITEENKKALERYWHREEVKRLWGIRAKLKAEAVKAKCSYHELKKLYCSLSWKEYDACLTLLNTKKFRSSFREFSQSNSRLDGSGYRRTNLAKTVKPETIWLYYSEQSLRTILDVIKKAPLRSLLFYREKSKIPILIYHVLLNRSFFLKLIYTEPLS